MQAFFAILIASPIVALTFFLYLQALMAIVEALMAIFLNNNWTSKSEPKNYWKKLGLESKPKSQI